jgi:hypothetical protein
VFELLKAKVKGAFKSLTMWSTLIGAGAFVYLSNVGTFVISNAAILVPFVNAQTLSCIVLGAFAIVALCRGGKKNIPLEEKGGLVKPEPEKETTPTTPANPIAEEQK